MIATVENCEVFPENFDCGLQLVKKSSSFGVRCLKALGKNGFSRVGNRPEDEGKFFDFLFFLVGRGGFVDGGHLIFRVFFF